MQVYWNFSIFNFPNLFRKKYLRIIDYIIKIFLTIKVVYQENPKEVWIQLPPTFIIHILLIFRLITRRKFKIIGDAHNSFFRKKWLFFPFMRSAVKRIDLLVVHNNEVLLELKNIFGDYDHFLVLEDKPFVFSNKNNGDYIYKSGVVFPCSFDEDEPIEVVLDVARQLPEYEFYITGNYLGKLNQDLISFKPSNVNFLGYVSVSDYEDLFLSSLVILGLTTRENVQLSVATEGVAAFKPMVLSNTKVLKELFFKGAVFVETLNSNSISNGILEAIRNNEKMVEDVKELFKIRENRWMQQANLVDIMIKGV